MLAAASTNLYYFQSLNFKDNTFKERKLMVLITWQRNKILSLVGKAMRVAKKNYVFTKDP